MKGAFGRDAGRTDLLPGLDVIAQALNQDDLGRAMVAALHLRLPQLSWEGASRIARADQTLTKYDPNEPRDAHGRWTTAGAPRQNPPVREMAPRRTLPTYSAKPDSLSGNGGSRSNESPPQEAPGRTVSPGAMRPILVSNPSISSATNDNDPPLEPPNLVAYGLTKLCIAHARDPGFQTKIESCATSFRQCEWLVMGTRFNPLSEDTCQWPDGSMARLKFNLLFPFPIGKPF
jgi:hypothetical protein